MNEVTHCTARKEWTLNEGDLSQKEFTIFTLYPIAVEENVHKKMATFVVCGRCEIIMCGFLLGALVLHIKSG